MTPETAVLELAPIIEMAASYGLNGLMVIALVYIVNRFDTQLEKRDQRENLLSDKVIVALESNAKAMSELSTIIRDRRISGG